MSGNDYTATIKEQCSDSKPVEIKVNILSEGGQIWIQPEGYGEKCAMDGQGYPIGLEIWQGKLRLIAFNDINSEEPQIIDLEKAKESCRDEYCKAAEYLAEQGRKIFLGPMIGGIWNGACITASIISKDICINGSKPLPQFKRGDKGAYEYLLKIADKYSPCLNDAQRQTLNEIKVNAAAFLISVKPTDSIKEELPNGSMKETDKINGQDSLNADPGRSVDTIPVRCNWCSELIKTEPIKWKELPFCSELCLDACRAVQ